MDGTRDSTRQDWVRAAIIGGATYFFLFAAAAALFEAVSQLVAVPGFDGAPDYAIREPILFVTCWIASLGAAIGVPLRPVPRLVMGFTGFVLLLLTEVYVSLALQNESPLALAREFTTLGGILRLIGYVGFGLAPLLQIWIRLQLPDEHGNGANSASS
ncbi:MAG TPA: hypothetical protein VGL66_11455 [Caulobacteraceae bacterium]